MIKDNQQHFNRLHVVVDALVVAAAYLLAWTIQFKCWIIYPALYSKIIC